MHAHMHAHTHTDVALRQVSRTWTGLIAGQVVSTVRPLRLQHKLVGIARTVRYSGCATVILLTPPLQIPVETPTAGAGMSTE